MNNLFNDALKNFSTNIIETIQKCIRFKGFSGSEEERINYLLKLNSILKFNKIYKDSLGNLIAEMRFGSGKGPKIVLTGHMDTVGANEKEWDASTPPFSDSIIDDKIYGRGASDMLGSVVTMIYAISALKKNRSFENLNGMVYFVGTVVEELFEGVAFLEAIKNIQPDYVIVGEASNCKINIGQRGRAEIFITSYGQSQHASTGRKVINAIEQIAYIIDAFHRWYRSAEDPILGKRNIVPTDIKIPIGGGGGIDGRGGNSTVPNRVELTYDIRTLVGDTPETILAILNKELIRVVKNARKRYPNFKDPTIQFSSAGIKTYTGKLIKQIKYAPAWKTNKNSAIVKKALAGLNKAGFKNTELGAYNFCTDGSAIPHYKKLFPNKNIEIIGYGPGSEESAHTINESIKISEIKNSFKGFMGILSELFLE